MAGHRPRFDFDGVFDGGPAVGDPGPVHVLVDGTLHRLVVLTEAEWAALPADGRPRHAQYFDGLGWVAAVPAPELNN